MYKWPGGCLKETASFTYGSEGAGVFWRANLTGLLANAPKSEGMAVRIRLSFVSIVAPLTEETGGAVGLTFGAAASPLFLSPERVIPKEASFSFWHRRGWCVPEGGLTRMGGVGYFIRVSLALTSLAILLPHAGRKARGPSPDCYRNSVKKTTESPTIWGNP